MPVAAELVAAVRRHYTPVCQCDYADDHDFDERIATSSECVMHGDEPDPLFSLLAELEHLRGALKEIAEFDIGVRLAPVAACKEIASAALGGDARDALAEDSEGRVGRTPTPEAADERNHPEPGSSPGRPSDLIGDQNFDPKGDDELSV